MIVKGICAQRGLIPVVAEGGDIGLDMARRMQPDAILLDIMLPVMDGWTVLNHLKEDPQTQHIPVHLMSATEVGPSEALLKGAQGFLKKPVEKDQLEKVLDSLTSPNVIYLSTVKEELNTEVTLLPVENLTDSRTILLVDDDIRNIFALTSALQNANFKFEIAYNGKEALEKLEENPEIELVLMDIMMPVMDGFEAIEVLRKDSRFFDLPVIAITAKAMKDDRDKCLAIGANEYISKPVDIDVLLEHITRFLKLTEA